MFIKELAAELWFGFRHLSPQRVWDWLTEGCCSPRLWTLLVIVPLVAWLGGCATSSRVSGTPNSAIVIWASLPEALPMAEEHCAKHGKHAQYSGSPHPYELIFNCVN